MDSNNLRRRLEVATFYSDLEQSSMEDTLISMYSSKEELEMLSNLEEEERKARHEFNEYRFYLLNKATYINDISNFSGYKR